MAYQLSTIRTRIQQKLDDTSFSTATLNQFINDAQRDILNSRRFVFMEREADVTTSVGSTALTGVPTTMQTPLTLRVHTPVGYAAPLPYIEYEDFDVFIPNPSIAGNSTPNSWYIFNLTPYIYPQADNTYTLKLKYIKQADELTSDASVPEIPESFGELLVLGGYKRALEFNDENDKAQLIQQQIDEQMDKLDQRYKRQSGAPHIMRQPNRVRQQRSF